MIPKVIFRYSWIYDQNWKEWLKIYRKKAQKYPSPKKVLNYIKKVEKLWRKNEKKILEELSKTTGIKWKEKVIRCYIVGRCIPFSDPLTLPVYEKYPDYSIDVLTHELIHRLFLQDFEKTKKAWEYFDRKYKRESQKVRVHIVLHAIHSHIFLKFFGEKRLRREVKIMSRLRDYKRAWQIVQKEGYQNIIKELNKRIK